MFARSLVSFAQLVCRRKRAWMACRLLLGSCKAEKGHSLPAASGRSKSGDAHTRSHTHVQMYIRSEQVGRSCCMLQRVEPCNFPTEQRIRNSCAPCLFGGLHSFFFFFFLIAGVCRSQDHQSHTVIYIYIYIYISVCI